MSDPKEPSRSELTLDEIQREIDCFLARADPGTLRGYEARVLASQQNRSRTASKQALLDEIRERRRARKRAGEIDVEEAEGRPGDQA